MNLQKNWGLIILLCLTLGLAPFRPEPHIWGKIKWILGGGKDMTLMDWGDTVLHGFPFVLLLIMVFMHLANKIPSQKKS